MVRKYCPLEEIDYGKIRAILDNGTYEELVLLPLRVGEYGNDWKKSQSICLGLMDNESEIIRANAVLGLSYIARTQKNLDKRLVKPYLLRELERNKEYRWRIIDAIEDINLFLNWNIAKKKLKVLRSL